MVGDGVYVGGDGALSLAWSDGEGRWRATFEELVASSPAVDDGRAHVGSADGHLYCIGEG